jgi:sulfate-transporting ATPase
MAGLDTEIEGEAGRSPASMSAICRRSRSSTRAKDVRGNVEEAVAPIKQALERLDQVYAAYAEPDADFDALAKEQGELEDLIEATDGHNLERTLEVAADALRLPPWEADVTKLSGGERRRVALCRLLLQARHAAARRAHQPPRRRVRRLAGALPARLPGTVVAVTHDRYFLDNVAGWILELDRGHGIPWEGNYSSWLEQKEPAWSRKRSRSRPASRP